MKRFMFWLAVVSGVVLVVDLAVLAVQLSDLDPAFNVAAAAWVMAGSFVICAASVMAHLFLSVPKCPHCKKLVWHETNRCPHCGGVMDVSGKE